MGNLFELLLPFYNDLCVFGQLLSKFEFLSSLFIFGQFLDKYLKLDKIRQLFILGQIFTKLKILRFKAL